MWESSGDSPGKSRQVRQREQAEPPEGRSFTGRALVNRHVLPGGPRDAWSTAGGTVDVHTGWYNVGWLELSGVRGIPDFYCSPTTPNSKPPLSNPVCHELLQGFLETPQHSSC